MDRWVHFTLQDLLGALHCQRSDLCAQFFAGAGHLLLGVGLGCSDDTGGFFGSGCLGCVDDLGSALFSVVN